MNTIRLSINTEFETILNELQKLFPLLEKPELIRMAVSRFYTQNILKKTPSEQSFSDLLDAYMATPGGIEWDNEDEMSDWWAKHKSSLRE